MSIAIRSMAPSCGRLFANVFPMTTVRAGTLLRETGGSPCVWFIRKGVVGAERISRLGRRHIPAIYLPGEAAGLAAAMLGRVDDGLRAITDLQAEVISADRLRQMIEDDAAAANRFSQMALASGAIWSVWATSLAIRDARSKLAHLFCELGQRWERAGLGSKNDFAHPFTQEHIGDILGMTPVHTNRTLKSMAADRLISYIGKRVHILDRPALERVAEFDPAYLG